MSANIKVNFLYSSFLTTANYLFTFLTYPYVSRVLGVEKIGAVNFVDSVINYFIMLSMLGIAIVGIREVAKAKNNQKELNSTFSSLFVINCLFMLVALLCLGVTYLCVQDLQRYSMLVCIGVVKLIANVFLMDWFFKGIENFKIITFRTFFVRLAYVIAIFTLVRKPEDYGMYFFVTTITIAVNALVNCLFLRGIVTFSLSNLRIKTFLTPVCILGLYMIFCNFYSSFNIMFLGVEKGDVEVGNFTTATKLFTIILSVYTAFTSVMMPRMSSLLKENKLEEYTGLYNKSVSIVMAFCIPLVLLTIFQAKNIILIISGEGYDGAVLPMMLCMPLLLVVGYNQILMNQGLMPLCKDKAIMTSSVTGGLVAFVLCFILIPKWGCVGASILWLCSEITVNIVAGIFVYRYIGISFPYKKFLISFMWHIPLVLLLFCIQGISNYIVETITASLLTLLYCFVLQCFIVRDAVVRHIFKLL